MKKLDRYNNFTNEGLFSKKRKEPTFDDAINEIDKSFMIAIGFKGADRILKFISQFADIGEKLIKILENFGMNMTQEQMDEFIKRFNAFEKQCIGLGYRLTDYKSLITIRNNENTLLDLLDHIKNIRDLQVNIKPEKFDNPLVFYKHGGYFYLVHKSWLKKKREEEKEKHKGVDPYGEEDWGDEKNEGIKWYKKGEFEDDPNQSEEETHYDDFITDDRFRQFLIDEEAYEIFLKYAYIDVKENFKRYSGYPDIIDLSLDWVSTPTPEGEFNSAFWGDLNRRWIKIFKKK